MMGRKQKLICSDEWDVLYGKKIYCYLQNYPKNIRDVKRRLNKRYRKQLKNELRHELEVVKNNREEE